MNSYFVKDSCWNTFSFPLSDLTEHQARVLKAAGLDRINHNLNTSRRFYPEICSTHTYERRIQNIQMLQRVGFEICCGGIIGMGESKEDVVDMLLDLVAINPESVPINFLLPVKGTRLAERDVSNLTFEYCMKILCLARFNPEKFLFALCHFAHFIKID